MLSKLKIILLHGALLGALALDAKTYQMHGKQDQKHATKSAKIKLFKSVGCDYSNEMCILDSECCIHATRTIHYKEHKASVDRLSKQYEKDVRSYKLAPMYLKFVSHDVGYGIFASKPIKKDDFIGVYAGELRLERWHSKDFDEDVDYAWYYTVSSAQNKKIIIDGKYVGNELRFINHDDKPNTHRIDVVVDDIWYVCYIASRDIAKDEQLTVSYGEGYWTSRGILPRAP